jgi:hypothetical protein
MCAIGTEQLARCAFPFYKNRNNDIFIFRTRAEFNYSFWSFKIHRTGHLHDSTVQSRWLLHTNSRPTIQKFILPEERVSIFGMDFRTSCYHFPVQNWVWLFITERECVYCAVRTVSLTIIRVNFWLERIIQTFMQVYKDNCINTTKWTILGTRKAICTTSQRINVNS